MNEKPLALVVILFGCVVGYFAFHQSEGAILLMIPGAGLVLTGVYMFVRK